MRTPEWRNVIDLARRAHIQTPTIIRTASIKGTRHAFSRLAAVPVIDLSLCLAMGTGEYVRHGDKYKVQGVVGMWLLLPILARFARDAGKGSA